MIVKPKKILTATMTVCVAISILGVLSLVMMGCEKTEEVEGTDFEEWVSPDGVHYWVHSLGGYTGLMSPRYDSNGNVMVDKEKVSNESNKN